MTNADVQEQGDHRFLIGLIAGGALGVCAMVFGPRLISGLREQVVDSAKSLGRTAQGVRDDMVDAVAHGAHEVERLATEAKTEHAVTTRTHSTAQHATSE